MVAFDKLPRWTSIQIENGFMNLELTEKVHILIGLKKCHWRNSWTTSPRVVDKQNNTIDLSPKLQQYFAVLFETFEGLNDHPWLIGNADEIFTQVGGEKTQQSTYL